MKNEFKVVFVGEYDTGKSELINYISPLDSADSNNKNNHDYWSKVNSVRQAQVNNSNGDSIKLNIHEVSGSRGRMSNYYTLINETHNADLIVYCFRRDKPWSISSYSRVMSMANAKGKKEKETDQKLKKPDTPYIFVETFIDTKTSAENFSKVESVLNEKKEIPLVQCSNFTHKNVDLVFTTIADCLCNIGDQKEKEEKLAKEAASTADEKGSVFSVKNLVEKFFKREAAIPKPNTEDGNPVIRLPHAA